MENDEEAKCEIFHFPSLILLIFHAKLFWFIYTSFSLHLQACFNIVYLGYIICKNAFFYSEFGNILTIVNLNQSQQQPNFRCVQSSLLQHQCTFGDEFSISGMNCATRQSEWNQIRSYELRPLRNSMNHLKTIARDGASSPNADRKP